MQTLEMKRGSCRRAEQRNQAINCNLTYQRLRCCGRILNDQEMNVMTEQGECRGQDNSNGEGINSNQEQGLRKGYGRGNRHAKAQRIASNQGRGRGQRNGNGQGKGQRMSNGQDIQKIIK